MFRVSNPNYISCSFVPGHDVSHCEENGVTDVYFAETKDLSSVFPDLYNFISYDEKLKADKFKHGRTRETYISCHAILRLVLAQYLNVKPSDLIFQVGANGKPGLVGNPVFFNITHTNDAFAIVVFKDSPVGLDLERINRKIDIHSIIKTYFSKDEREYILKPSTDLETKDRFFLLWTRKEAMLKALGVGIIDKLSQVEVSGNENFINKDLFEKIVYDNFIQTIYLYSVKVLNYYLSIALPNKSSIYRYNLNSENINSYFE
jgi:4'-phosphopantetheinyl transferase